LTPGTAASQTVATESFPAGLIIGGCSIRARFAWAFLGTGASTKNIIVDDNFNAFFWHNRSALAANIKSFGDEIELMVTDASTSTILAMPNQANQPNYVTGTGGSSSALARSTAFDANAAWNLRWRINCATDESWALVHRHIEIRYK
jgi:hypothetical protein